MYLFILFIYTGRRFYLSSVFFISIYIYLRSLIIRLSLRLNIRLGHFFLLSSRARGVLVVLGLQPVVGR